MWLGQPYLADFTTMAEEEENEFEIDISKAEQNAMRIVSGHMIMLNADKEISAQKNLAFDYSLKYYVILRRWLVETLIWEYDMDASVANILPITTRDLDFWTGFINLNLNIQTVIKNVYVEIPTSDIKNNAIMELWWTRLFELITEGQGIYQRWDGYYPEYAPQSNLWNFEGFGVFTIGAFVRITVINHFVINLPYKGPITIDHIKYAMNEAIANFIGAGYIELLTTSLEYIVKNPHDDDTNNTNSRDIGSNY